VLALVTVWTFVLSLHYNAMRLENPVWSVN
jgi:hypothetical protein